jgi:hypothetical protein
MVRRSTQGREDDSSVSMACGKRFSQSGLSGIALKTQKKELALNLPPQQCLCASAHNACFHPVDNAGNQKGISREKQCILKTQ